MFDGKTSVLNHEVNLQALNTKELFLSYIDYIYLRQVITGQQKLIQLSDF